MQRLVEIIARLRGKNGCPWDRRQTPDSIVRYMVEEVYELAEAIASDRPDHIRDELGDVLFHVLFLVRMYEEKGQFRLDDVLQAISAKMIRRHPHVFGTAEARDSAEVVRRWHAIKRQENGHRSGQSLMDTIPHRLPSLMRAYKLSARAAAAEFDWETLEDVVIKLEEEMAEFKSALASGPPSSVKDELGDMLFTLVNVARLAGIHPDTALGASNRKFEKRFRRLEELVAASGRELDAVPQKEKDALWNAVKDEEPD
jgi:tetrapyrrole methylase family protein/MazG family protein